MRDPTHATNGFDGGENPSFGLNLRKDDRDGQRRLGQRSLPKLIAECRWTVAVGIEQDQDRAGTDPRAFCLKDAALELTFADDSVAFDAKWSRNLDVVDLAPLMKNSPQ